jgi:hypothetical protein
MPNLPDKHSADLLHHITLGNAWLADASGGERSVPLTYAAFEFRFAVERLAVQYWVALLRGTIEEKDLRDIEKFDRIQQRIYELGGHQKEINGHFDFMRIFVEALQLPIALNTPKIGELANHWHTCSKYCHIAWPLDSIINPDLGKEVFSQLGQVAASLQQQAGSLGWPVLEDPSIIELRNRYIAGKATRADVWSFIEQKGLWARVTLPDGHNEFIGQAIPPKGE